MAFDPEGFLNLAREILSGDPSEAGLRTAISRSYYAVHHKAADTLAADALFTRTYSGVDHEMVIELLRGRRGPEGDRVDTLRKLRNRADYRIDVNIEEKDARYAFSLATAVWPKI